MKSFAAALIAFVAAVAIAVSAQNATVPTTTQTTSFQVPSSNHKLVMNSLTL